MSTPDVNINLVDSYYTLLKNLSPNNKLELIARLSKSMKTTKVKKILPGKHYLAPGKLTNLLTILLNN